MKLMSNVLNIAHNTTCTHTSMYYANCVHCFYHILVSHDLID